MSDVPEWANCCQAEQAIVLAPSAYSRDSQSAGSNPIDEYYAHTIDLARLARPERFDEDSVFGRIILLGLVSAAEFFFRRLICETIEMCPIATVHVQTQMISLGSLSYYGKTPLMALLENSSFSTKSEILKQTIRLLDISTDTHRDSSLLEAISTFETVCVVRHAAVHSRGELSPGNVRELKLPSIGPQRIRVDFQGFQNAMVATHSTIRAYNRFLFRRAIERWATKRELKGDWETDNESFSRAFKLFHSTLDNSEPIDPKTAYLLYHPILLKILNRPQ